MTQDGKDRERQGNGSEMRLKGFEPRRASPSETRSSAGSATDAASHSEVRHHFRRDVEANVSEAIASSGPAPADVPAEVRNRFGRIDEAAPSVEQQTAVCDPDEGVTHAQVTVENNATVDEAGQTFVESDPIRSRFQRHEESRQEAAAPATESRFHEDSAYQPDIDPGRVNRRQYWKYNLYVKSGRQAADARDNGQ